MSAEDIRVNRQTLEQFCQSVFRALCISEEDSKIAASLLVASDAFGIPSHGVGRLWRYVNGLKTVAVACSGQSRQSPPGLCSWPPTDTSQQLAL